MPTYTFRNKKTGEEFDHFVKMDDKEQYMKDKMFEVYKNDQNETRNEQTDGVIEFLST